MRIPNRIAAGAAIVILCGAAFAVLRAAAPAMPMGPDSTAVADAGSPGAIRVQSEKAGFLGVLTPGEAVDVATRIDGLITGVELRLGDQVEENKVIATIDDRAPRDELAMALAGLNAALADQERASLELAEARERRQRWHAMSKDGGVEVVSQEELTSLTYKQKYAAQRLKSAEAQVAEYRARVHNLERRVAESTVRAPFAGVVAKRYVDPGATVQPGDPIVRLVRGGDFWVRFAIPEQKSAAVRRGQAVTVRAETVDAALSGVVEKVAPEVDDASRMIFAEARLTVPEALRDLALAGRVVRVYVDASEP
jgi:RND family efflux transporter MFP subunit